ERGRHRGRDGRPREERPGEARRRAGGRALRGELRGRHLEAPPGARRPAGAAPPAPRLRGRPTRPAEAPHRRHGLGGEAPDRDAGGAAGGLRPAPAVKRTGAGRIDRKFRLTFRVGKADRLPRGHAPAGWPTYPRPTPTTPSQRRRAASWPGRPGWG